MLVIDSSLGFGLLFGQKKQYENDILGKWDEYFLKKKKDIL